MRMMRDFQCSYCSKETEAYIESDIIQITCTCGNQAYRMIGMPKIALDGTDPSFPGAYDKWARTREQNARVNAKRNS